jgi:transposase InsO family protein
MKPQEVAEAMNVSTRSVERRVQQGELPVAATAPARNGKQQPLFDPKALPSAAQAQWAEKSFIEGPLELAPLRGPKISSEGRAAAMKKYHAIKLLREHTGPWDGKKGQAVSLIEKQEGVKARTILRWERAWDKSKILGLLGEDRADKGRPRIFNKAALDFVTAAALPKRGVYGVLSVREIFRAYEEERIWRAERKDKPRTKPDDVKYARYLGEDGRLLDTAQLPQASYGTFLAWFNRIPEVARTMAREGEEAFHNTQEILSFRDISALQPLEYVVMDDRVLDIWCLAPDRGGWKLIRPWLTAAICMRTRKWLGWVIVETPSSDSIAAVLKRVFIEHGIPQNVYWDNGKTYKCQWLEGRREQSRSAGKIAELPWSGVLESLNVRVTHAIVKRARSKIIEPNFLNVALFDRTLPEHCGNRPGTRPEVFEQMVSQHQDWAAGKRPTTPFKTISEVSAIYDDLFEVLNEREHSGEGMSKMLPTGKGWYAPNEIFEILIRKVERRTAPPEVLQLCFAKHREITIRHGEARASFGGQAYHYRLNNQATLMAFNGRKVDLAYDNLDLGTTALYCDGAFLGLASCCELRRMGEDAFTEDERLRRQARREVKRAIEALHQTVPIVNPEIRLSRRRAVLPSREGVVRPEKPLQLPAALMEAAAATRAEKDFRFGDATAAIAKSEQPAQTDSADDEFRFFAEGEN